MFEVFREDVRRYRTLEKKLAHLFFEQGLWAIGVYRFGQWVREFKFPVVSFFLRVLAYLLHKCTEIMTGISIPSSAKIGKGFYIGHFGHIILHTNVVIGEHCSVGPGVIMGTRGLGNTGVPILGDHVYVGTGAKILGGVRIGDKAMIGANAVVLTDIPNGATAVGIPAKVVKTPAWVFLWESLEPLTVQTLIAI